MSDRFNAVMHVAQLALHFILAGAQGILLPRQSIHPLIHEIFDLLNLPAESIHTWNRHVPLNVLQQRFPCCSCSSDSKAYNAACSPQHMVVPV